MTTSLLRPPRQTADERREQVIAAAIVEFATFGYHAGSTESIARKAGISQPYVLRLFGTKKQLFQDSMAKVTNEIMELWQTAAAETDPDLPPDERLGAIGSYYAGAMENPYAMQMILQSFAAAADPEIRAGCQRSLDLMHTWLIARTGASPFAIQQFFAIGMMLTVAGAIGAPALAEHRAWASTFSIPIDAAEPS